MGHVCALVVVVMVAGCAGGTGPHPRGGTAEAEAGPNQETRSRVASMTFGDAPGAAVNGGNVQGAIAPAPEAQVPSDITSLSSRMTPRDLPIPVTLAGMTESFTFDGSRRGWFARVPGGHQTLLTPAYGNGKVFLGGGFGSSQFFAYNARNGDPLWTASAPDGGPTAAIVEDDKVLFNTESCTLFAIDVNTGEHLWRRWLGDPLMGQPASGNGMVFSGHVIDGRSPGHIRRGSTGWGTGGGRRYGFTAMRARDGRPRWTRQISADVMNGPILDGRSVFFTTMDGVVYHLDQRSGRVRWRRDVGATSAPWLHGASIHVTARNGDHAERTVVLASRNGETIRHMDAVDASFLNERADTGGVRSGWAYEGSRPTIVQGRTYQTIGNEVHCRDASTGDLIWRREYTQNSNARAASPPAVAGGQLVFGTRQGQLYALDIDTGMTVWAYDVGEPIAAQPSIAHGWVYASTSRSGLVALEVSDPSFDGWHMWGGSASHNGPTLGTPAPLEDRGRPTEGTLQLAEEPNLGELGGFPIQDTRVTARVTGFVARVRVEQTFQNPYERPVDVSYLFPVPEGAAISGMELHSGQRVVRAQVRPRDAIEAAAADPSASAEPAAAGTGTEHSTTTVLEQQRPDLFRQSIRAVRPSEEVTVVLEYTQVLPYAEGAYQFIYPLVAGSRYERATGESYNPAGTPLERELSGEDERPDGVHITIETEAGTGAHVSSPTHELDVSQLGERRQRVEMSSEARPDRDFEARIEVGADEPAAALVASPPTDRPGFLAIALHPRLDVDDEVMPRELVLVLDRSSSMRGAAMEIAQATALRALTGLRPTDTFRVLTLDGPIAALGGAALPATRSNIARAQRAVRGLAIRGTGDRAGLLAALEGPTTDDRLRVVVLATDGYLGSERDVFREVRERMGDSRLFALGVGTAVNQYVLTRIVEMGRGELDVVPLDTEPAAAAERFHARIGRPYLTDLSISFDGVDVVDVYPRRIPDVYEDRPVVVHGRFARGGEGRFTVRGRIAGRAFEQVLEVTLPEAGPERPELEAVWARTRIDDLMTAMALAPNASLRRTVTQLGVRHNVLTPYTTFVAVDPGDPREVATERTAGPAVLNTSRPERDASAHVGPCYAQSRNDEGEIDQEALAACLAAAELAAAADDTAAPDAAPSASD